MGSMNIETLAATSLPDLHFKVINFNYFISKITNKMMAINVQICRIYCNTSKEDRRVRILRCHILLRDLFHKMMS